LRTVVGRAGSPAYQIGASFLPIEELEVFQRTLGEKVTVQRTAHLLSGDSRCAYRFTAADGSPAKKMLTRLPTAGRMPVASGRLRVRMAGVSAEMPNVE